MLFWFYMHDMEMMVALVIHTLVKHMRTDTARLSSFQVQTWAELSHLICILAGSVYVYVTLVGGKLWMSH